MSNGLLVRTIPRLRPAQVSLLPLVAEGYGIVDPVVVPLESDPAQVVDGCVARVEALTAALIAAGYADGQRLIVGGFSGGAWLAALLLGHSSLFAAGIACSGVYDRIGRQIARFLGLAPGDEARVPAPLAAAGAITRPLLLVYGAEDEPCRRQAAALAAAVREAGGTVSVRAVAGEGHFYEERRSRLAVMRQLVGWCLRHAPVQHTMMVPDHA